MAPLAPIGRANGAGPRPEKARPARGRRTSATDAVPCTVADPQDPTHRMTWRALQPLVRCIVNTPRTSGQRPSVLQSRAGRCARSWQSWRNGSWTTGTWTRTGAKIGSYSLGSWFTDRGLLRHNTRIVVNQSEAVLPYFRPVVLGPRT